jgi:hypothetical protein
MSSKSGLLGFTVVLLAGCAPPAGEEVTAVSQPVMGGQSATACQWPTAVMVDLTKAQCSGTLVHPRLVTLAAHCQLGGTVNAIYLGETVDGAARKLEVETCKFYPNFRYDVNDVAYCVLKQPVTDVPIAPVLMGCETAILTRGRKVDMVGFGLTSTRMRNSFGTKRWAEVPILNTVGAATTSIQVGASRVTGCEGDSGGPTFVRLADGTWRTIGDASTTFFGPTGECSPPTSYMLLYKFVGWIEQSSGIDITPCHDANGRWNPSADCGRFAISIDQSTGDWANGCNAPGALSSEPSKTCAGDTDGGAPAVGSDAGSAPDLAPDVAAAVDLAIERPAVAPPGPRRPDAGATAVTATGDAGPPISPEDDAGPTIHSASSGCSCRIARKRPVGPWALAVCLLAWRRRRRSVRLPPH